jgi:drug/metabolite transporter (DMT)-like permease
MTHLVALLGVAIISFSAIFVRLAAVEASTAAFFRCAYALPFLLALNLAQRGAVRRQPRARALAFVAGIFLGLDLAFWHRAIDFIGAGLATVLGNTQVIFIAFLAWAIHGERPRPAALFAAPVVFTGVALISGIGTADAYGSDPTRGVLFGILTGITYSAFLLIYRVAGRGLGSPTGPLLDATAGATVAAAIFGSLDGTLNLSVSWPAHGWLLALALASQVVGWHLIGAVLPRLPALDTSIMLLLQPMMTVAWARLLFGEELSLLQGLGIALVLGGVGWFSLRGSAQK